MYFSPTKHLLYSPSDLILYMRSPFASWMERLAVEKPELVEDIETDQDAMMELLADKGNNHENTFLAELKNQFGNDNVFEINTENRDLAAKKTKTAMHKGYPVIFQAYLQRDGFAGFADFLIKRDGCSELGDYYYEAWDTKLSRTTRPYFLVQLCCYSWMLEKIQGIIPEETVVVLGNQQQDRYRIAAYYSYFTNLKTGFLNFQQKFTGNFSKRPDPAFEKEYGRWSSYAEQLLKQSDSLALVANMRKSQIKKLLNAGIHTMSELADSEITSIKSMAPETFNKLKDQAEIQCRSRGQDKPEYQIIQSDNGKGLSALPPASELDIYFDIEGHSIIDGGLEYLWGVSYKDKCAPQGNHYAFKDWWGHNQVQEKQAFEDFIDWSYQRWQQDPGMHIYHYASYEVTAMRKLSIRYETRQEQVAELLRNGVMVDLYKIVKNGLLIGEPKYSIKNVEHLYRGKRDTDVANGADSMVFYENWRDRGGLDEWCLKNHGYQGWRADPDNFDWNQWPVLKDIRDYNIDDCESTLELADWLRVQQQSSGITYSPAVSDETNEAKKTDRQITSAEKKQALLEWQKLLHGRYDSDDSLKQDRIASLLNALLGFYNRERKPKAWAYFERMEKTEDQLFDDDMVILNMTIKSINETDGMIRCSGIYDSAQPIRKDKFSSATIADSDLKIKNLQFTEPDGNVDFEIAAQETVISEDSIVTLFADEPFINTEKLEQRLCKITEDYFNNRLLTPALEIVFKQAAPVFNNNYDYLPITRQQYQENDSYLNAIITAIKEMNNSCLCIQGPPGAGKTYTAKHVITALVNQGKRVGVMSNSHAAIMNLIKPLSKQLKHHVVVKIGGLGKQSEFKEHYPEHEHPNFKYRTGFKFTKKQPYEAFSVVGATAYGFASDIAYESPLDYLFVDEASQVALANLVAVSGAAKNIILMGDQMQLEQPVQGSHPDQAGSSALEYMLEDHAVIPEHKGIFLERTYRMHPAVCQPLSEVVYEGKLQADADNSNQVIQIPSSDLIHRQNGILTINVQHEDNTQCSHEEVDKVQQLIVELKTGQFIDKQGQAKPIDDHDILVIAPYNMQVNLLKDKINGNIKIGTIDKFQGQEAPVVIISMAISDVEESSRGLDFVFDINRLNVAVSRAKALAIIVSNQDQGNCQVNSLRQMEKVGFFCHLKKHLCT